MGRRKQIRPRRAGGVVDSGGVSKEELGDPDASQGLENELSGHNNPFYVEVDRNNWVSEEHYDISEVLLMNLNASGEFQAKKSEEQHCFNDEKYGLRFRLSNVNEFLGRIKLGHWPVLSATDIYLEFTEKRESMDIETHVMVTGNFDGPNEGVSGLVHLVNMKLLTLRPILGATFSGSLSSIRLRVEIQKCAFEACESLFENTRQLWKKSMMNVMTWLRPEVMTSEARYGYKVPEDIEIGLEPNEESVVSRKRARLDVSGFYEAIKPSKDNPMLIDDMPGLLPELRPYQRRAAFWMVQREKGAFRRLGGSEPSQSVSPLCMPVELVDSGSKIYYNSFSGSVSMNPENCSSYVVGGILADEMGLGKTIELLACIFAHRKLDAEADDIQDETMQVAGEQTSNVRRMKRDRIECVCGAVSEGSKYKGLWVQCDVCDAWQHADCVGYPDKGTNSRSRKDYELQGDRKSLIGDSRKRKSNRGSKIVVCDEDYICPLCLELIQATNSPVASGTTLVVCPAPILPQWHAEITRHTSPGSLKVLVYEGVKTTSPSTTSVTKIGELLSADIVLTTYDVLKEDLSHDSDRHEGDRRLMRYQKRYPVIPTLLTRIFWWRLCLDEAQMVESNAAAATEMAMRLPARHRWCITGTPIQRKLDDLYGLLRFLKASPYDVLRWWVDVIRDPYEQGDVGAVEFTHNLFKQIMWRSSKSHVAEELLLPPQEECLSWLSLTPIEEHFYQRQHETCLAYAREVIQSFKSNITEEQAAGNASSDSFLTHVEAAKLLNSLLKLRQACCHPQVGSSGLRSLHQSPMTMEEILMVLVGKTKVEGEEALRKLVVALNGLAGLAIIKQDFPQAISLYKEALELAEEHSEDFRVDPLLNIHIHYNLAEILPLTSVLLGKQCPGCSGLGRCEGNICKMCDGKEYDQHDVKRIDVSREDLDSTILNGSNDENNIVDRPHSMLSKSTSFQSLQMACNNLKQKFMSVFNSRLSVAQQEFRKSHDLVNNALHDRRNHHSAWWAEALQCIEQNKDSSTDFIRKIGDAVSGTLNTSRTARLAACFRSITALKYYIQTGLDSLEDSRRTLLDRLLQLDQTMENPRQEDVERVRYCPNCQVNGDGLLCVHCELDELFQVYEARLFRLNKGHDGGVIRSAEEAVDLRKKMSALNRFYRTLSQPDKASPPSSYEDEGKKRDVGEKVMVSKSPSELEVFLGIIKSYSKVLLDKEAMSAARKHLFLLEGMRKEYAHARSLAIAQAQVLNAHDEIKMATSRLRLRDNEDDKSIDALSLEELEAASVENSSEKFLALSSLSRIKGQLRYLKGLVQSKQNYQSEGTCDSSQAQVMTHSHANSLKEGENEQSVQLEESCPVCQERLSNQKMVFQCGHVTCCKCFLAMTEQRIKYHGKSHEKWVMCPTCRHHTEFGNIAYVDDRQNKPPDASVHAFRSSEASVTVNGSYSTKIAAVTRRILCIGSTNPKDKILVFSSWNDVLDVLEHAFTANDISFIRMKGGRKSHVAISQFKGEKVGVKNRGNKKNRQVEPNSVQVMLLLIQHGANGLNLLEAQHVILVEPLLNPAAEAQAISRVHRIGQTKKTLVHRFIVKSTVEESIYKLNKSKDSGSFISGNKKNQDQPVLTLKDVESLFKVAPSTVEQPKKEEPTSSLMHLPPATAAGIAAERRLMEQRR